MLMTQFPMSQVPQALTHLQAAFDACQMTFLDHRIVPNAKKIKYMIFTTLNTDYNFPCLITLNGTHIPCV